VTAPLKPQRPIEDVARGALLSLLAIPVGVVLWTLIWSVGIVASIVAFVIAIAAVWLYRRGSGGLISRSGAWIVTLVVVVTLLLSFWVGMVVDYAGGLAHLNYLSEPRFFDLFNSDFAVNFNNDLPSFGLALLFSALGCFRVLGRAFATARATSSTTSTFGTAPEVPTSAYIAQPETQTEPHLNPESTGTISSAPDDRTPPATPRD
jgi:hypothetical protein